VPSPLRTIWLCSYVFFALPKLAGAQAAADPPEPLGGVPHTYALIVGSNPGGEGQAELHYAEDDARRMAELLTQLGHFTSAQTGVLVHPDRAHVFAALDIIGRRLAAHRAQGEQAQFIFYYSGHARASAIQLGGQELLLSELRERILALPTTLTLIVLDACQSGAFSNIKGAQPAATFSYNSVSRLRTSGVAVMASSTASELSQESDALRGSYFTHHLMVGLRGAGDRNRDGVVSLAEAYQYAYDRTLSATSRTAVGGQHVTLETALTGQGEIPLTYPAHAGAQLELSASLDADVMLEHDGSMVAELHKSPGRDLRLAFPAGAYTAVLRRAGELSECALALADERVTRLDTRACTAIDEDDARAKGYLPRVEVEAEPREAWAFEFTVGLGGAPDDAYTRRLQDFEYSDSTLGVYGRWQVALARQLGPHLSAVFDFRNYETATFERDLLSTENHEVSESFEWWTLALAAHLRTHVDVFDGMLRFYAQLGAGLGMGHSKLVDDVQNQFGPVLSGEAGMFFMPTTIMGLLLSSAYSYAPLLHNELGESRNCGGLQVGLGLRFRTWSTP
jgi:hypothetical protein